MSLQLARAESDGAAMLTTNSPFVLHLQNPPWVKEMQFTRSALFKAGATPSHIDKMQWGTETFKGAIQPSGYYLERLSSPPPGFGPPHSPDQRGLSGISKDYYWGAFWGGNAATDQRQLTLSPQDPAKGASDKNPGQISVESMQRGFERVRNFGFPALEPNSFALMNGHRFKAVTASGEDLSGEILNASGTRPYALTYLVGDDSAKLISLSYRYSNDRELPDYFELSWPNDARDGHEPQTNWIVRVDYGLDEKIQDGYLPSMFFPNVAMFNITAVYSNGALYYVKSDGKLTGKLAESPLWAGPSVPGRDHKLRFVMIVLPGALALAGFWWAKKKHKAA